MERLKLNEIKFSEMNDKRKRALYEAMWRDTKLDFQLQKTWSTRYNKYSDNSYSFSVGNIENKDLDKSHHDTIRNELKKIFGITNQAFDAKFDAACSGSGSELRKITTVHSSSLCALLCFYSISDEKPLHLKLNDKDAVFTKVLFEFQSKVSDYGKPSNVDLVLIGKRDGKDIILFLESKFSEYSEATKSLKINEYYLKDYKNYYNENLFKEKFGFNIDPKRNSENKFTVLSENPCYIDGIKQMISHHIGIENLIGRKYHNEKRNKNLKEIKHLINEKTEIYLGTILFDNVIGKIKYSTGESCVENYSHYYEKLNSYFQAVNNSKIITLEKPLYYSLFIDKSSKFELDEKVKQFYFGNISK